MWILLFDKSNEFLGTVLELLLLFQGLQELVNFGDEHPDDTNDNQVKEGKLDD